MTAYKDWIDGILHTIQGGSIDPKKHLIRRPRGLVCGAHSNRVSRIQQARYVSFLLTTTTRYLEKRPIGSEDGALRLERAGCKSYSSYNCEPIRVSLQRGLAESSKDFSRRRQGYVVLLE
jgi:hypothetical protein